MKPSLFFQASLLLSLASLNGLGYSSFVFEECPFYFSGTWTSVGKARFHHPKAYDETHLRYSEGGARGFYSLFLNPKEALTFQLGYLHYDLNWKQNPSFHQKNFNDLVGTVALTSRRPDCLFWTLELGTRVSCEEFNFKEYALYFGTLWGQYTYDDDLKFHFGITGHTGIEKSYALPIAGFEWCRNKWKLNAVFPIDASLRYQLTENWSSILSFNGFGGRYRANHRTGSNEPLPKAVYQLFSTGLDWGLCYGYKMIHLGLFGGWNFGGWIYIQNRHGAHGQYYKFDGAPYGTLNGSLIF